MFTRVILFRKKLLQILLEKAGFINIQEHWMYAPAINNQSLVIDMGSNRGAYSLRMKERFGCDCFAVEANKELCEQIALPANRKFNVAITNTDGPLRFFLSDNNEASSIIESFEEKWSTESVVEVEGVCWKTLLRRLNWSPNQVIDVLKVDVEGAELDLIESFEASDVAHVKQITIEYHDWLNKHLHERTLASIKKLKDFGFDTLNITPDTSWPAEVVFVNKKLVSYRDADKKWLWLFRKLAFKTYL